MTLNNDTLIFKGSTPWNGKVFRGTTLIWPTVTDEYEKQYLTFEVVDTAATGEFMFHSASGLPQPLDIEFSKNDGPWVHYVSASTADKTVAHGDKIRVKGTNDTYTSNMGNLGFHYSQMWISGGAEYHIYGNIMSLIYGDSYMGKKILTSSNWHCFHELFAAVEQDGSGANNGNNCTNAENLCLPATTLAEGCYAGMFAFSNIATAPKLPSRTLSLSCYVQMFTHCASLVSAPELPATTLVERCYYEMFEDCTSLNYVKCLATDMSPILSTGWWLSHVSSTGTFIKHPNATWPTGESGIPDGWTVQDAVL